MSYADDILNGSFGNNKKKKKKEGSSYSERILNGTFGEASQPKEQIQLTGSKLLDNVFTKYSQQNSNVELIAPEPKQKTIWDRILKAATPDMNTVKDVTNVAKEAINLPGKAWNAYIDYAGSGNLEKDAKNVINTVKREKIVAQSLINQFKRGNLEQKKETLLTGKEGQTIADRYILPVAEGANIAGKTVIGTTVDMAKGGYNYLAAADEEILKATGQISEDEYNERKLARQAFMKEDTTGKIWEDVFGWDKKTKDYVNKNSFVTEENGWGRVIQGMTYSLEMAAAGGAWKPITFLSASGSTQQNEYRKGASDLEALTVGTLGGGIEVFAETMFGGELKLPGTGKWASVEALENALTEKISNGVTRYAVQHGFNIANEQMEEVVGGIANSIVQMLVYKDKKELQDLYSNEQLMEDLFYTAITTALSGGTRIATQGGMNQVREDIKSGRSQITGYTQNEQNIIDTAIEQRMQEAKENGEKPKRKEIAEQVEEDLREGNISINELQKAIGGQEYQNYRANEDNIGNIRKQLKDINENLNTNYKTKVSKMNPEYQNLLNQKQQLEEQLKPLVANRQDLGNKAYTETIDALQNDGLAQRSIYEYEQGGVNYQYEKTDNMNDNEVGLKDSAAKFGNNTTQFHKFVDGINKVQQMSKNGINIRFTNTQDIKQKGIAGQITHTVQEGDTIESIAKEYGMTVDEFKELNGNVKLTPGENIKVYGFTEGLFDRDNNILYLNVDSNRALEEILGHELTHTLENTDDYTALRELLYKQAKKKGILESERKRLESIYDADTDIDSELTAELASKLFTDEKFIEQLGTKPSFRKTVMNFIDDMITAFKGTKEEKQLVALKRQYQKAFSNMNAEVEGEGNQFSVSDNVQRSIDINDYVEKNGYTFKNNGVLEVSNLTNKQIKDLIKIYKTTGYDDVSSEWLENRLKQGNMPLQREIADRFIEKELGYRPKIDTTQVFEDAEGNPLTKEQVEFYKDSDVRDIRGRLIPVYHRTNAEFTVFDSKAGKQHGNKYGKGFYFSTTPENYGNNTMKLYLNAKEGEYKYIPSKGYYVVQEANQIKNVDNLNPTSSPDIRYSISKQGKLQENGQDVTLETSNTGTTGSLMAIHNLSESKLNGILDLGGFPVPSIAITNPSVVSHDQYGEITALFGKETINPEYAANEVYDRDVWSPTFPTVDYNIDSKQLEKVSDKLGIRSYDLEDFADNNKTPEFLSDRLTRVDEVVDKYVADNNIEYETTYKNPELNVEFNELSNDIQQFVIDNDLDVFKLVNDENLRNEYYRLIKEYFYNASFPEQAKQKLYEEKIEQLNNYIDMQKGAGDGFVVRGFSRYQDDFNSIKNGLAPEVDEYATQKNKREAAINNGLKEYLINEVQPLFNEKGIYNGKEYLTPSGNRRSFWQLHDEYNLENIVNAMTKGDTKGTQNWIAGFGQIQAQMATEFNSLDEIRAAQDRLIPDANNTRLVELREALEADLDSLADKQDGWNGMEIASELVADFASKKNHDIETFRKLLKNDYQTFSGITDAEITKIIADLEQLKDLPTDYFEAKPQRAVGLDELEQLVIPNTTTQETKQRLQDMGIEYTEYDPTIEGDRNRVINQFDELKWSMNKENIAPIRQRGLTYDASVREQIAPTVENIEQQTTQELDLPFDVTFDEVKEVLDLPKDVDRTEYLKVSDTNESTGQEYENQYSPFDKAKKDLAQKKLEKFIEKETYKAIDQATNVAARYGEFNKSQKKQIKSELNRFANMTAEQLTNADTYNEFKDIVSQYADREMNFIDEHLKEVKKDVRNRKFNVSNIKDQITDYNDFRRQYFGRLNLTDTGSSIDSQYQELSQLYPEYFSPDVTTEADMLNTLAEFMDLDTTITEKYRLSEEEIDRITSKAFSTLVREAPTEQQIQEFEDEIDRALERRRSEVRRQQLLDEMGLTIDDIAAGKDINAIGFQRTDPIRLNEKVFGWEVGNKINDATIRQTIHNTAEKMRWQNQERNEIKELGIKARSKESAAVQKYGEGEYVNDLGEVVKYGDRELAAEFPNVATQEKIKRASEVLRGKYDRYIDQINEVLTDLGYDAIPKRQNYFRHFMELNDKFSQWGTPFNRQTMQEQDLPTDINGLTDQFKPGKNYFASALQRKGIKTTYDAITGIDGYLESAGNLIFHTEDIQRYRALAKLIRETYGQQHGLDNVDIMTEAEKNQRIEDVYGNKLSKYAAWLDEQANALAGKKAAIDRAVERMFGRKVYTAANTLKSQVGSNMTGFNIRSAMTNFASVVQGMSKTNKIALLKGTISTINNMIHDDGMTEKSDFLMGRYGTEQLSQKKWQKLAQAGQVFMEASDQFTSNQIWRSKYFENLSKGMNEEQAIKNADDFAARVMGNRVQGSTAEIFNSKTLGFLTQFQLEVNNQWSNIVHDNKIDLQSGNKTAASVIFQLGQLAAFSYIFNGIMKGLTGSDVMFDPIDLLKKLFNPDDDDKDKSMEERAREVFGDIVNQLPMASIFTGGRIPIQEAFKGAETGFKYLTGQTNEYGQNYTASDVFDDSLESLAYLFMPTGYGQLRKTYKGTVDLDYDVNLNPFEGAIGITKRPVRGSYTDSGNLRFTADDSIPGRIRSALFGQYANSEAQSYIKSGYKTIPKSRIEELQALEMSSSEYRRWQKEFNDAIATTVEIDGDKYAKYKDDYGNIYFYNKDTRTLLDSDYAKSNIDVKTLEKVDKNELIFDYVNNYGFTDEQRQFLYDENFTNTTTDKYGYEKYTVKEVDKKGKTVTKNYYYDPDTDTLYDSKYKEVDSSKLDELTKVAPSKTIQDAEGFDSYEEFDYSYKNPEKYNFIRQTGTYEKYKKDKAYKEAVDWSYNTPVNYTMSKAFGDDIVTYKEYMDTINDIKADKDRNGKSISGSRKQKVFNYVNSLDLNTEQKAMLIRSQYSSYDNYGYEIVNYLNNQTNITLDEEYEILKKLGYKINKQTGSVSW